MTAPTVAQRAQVIAGLRELADLLEAHPELPVSKYPRMRVAADQVSTDIDEAGDEAGRAFVDQAAVVLGIPAIGSDGHYDTTWLARGEGAFPSDPRWRVSYNVGYISTAEWADYNARKSYEPNIQTGNAR